eukprot:UN03348
MNDAKMFPVRQKNQTDDEWIMDFKNQDIFYNLLQNKLIDTDWNGHSRNKWIVEGYLSNALTRWIGYQFHKPYGGRRKLEDRIRSRFPHRTGRKYGRRISSYDGMMINMDEINDEKNDINFYNAIQFMMQTDYVLPLSTTFDPLHGVDITEIWNVSLSDICKHFGLDNSQYFKQWLHEHDKTKNRNVFMSYLSEKDFKALYKYNYFDNRLYELSKYIAMAHLRFISI